MVQAFPLKNKTGTFATEIVNVRCIHLLTTKPKLCKKVYLRAIKNGPGR
jgi:hypothetical protein